MTYSHLIARAGVLALALAALPAPAWDYEAHRFINQTALHSLPADFPKFTTATAVRERIAFLGGEPDRWRNTPGMALRHANHPDHFLDVEDLASHGLTPATASPFRYEFAVQLAMARAAHPTNVPAVDPARDPDHTRVLAGFLPWTLTEYYDKLKSQFSYLAAYQELGTPDEIRNAEENIAYVMGVMGHFAGDATQPLHTTKHYNGWVGENPRGFTTNRSFHSWIDGGFLRAAGFNTNEVLARVRPARLLWTDDGARGRTNIFPDMMAYVVENHKQLEPLYQLDKDRGLSPRGEKAGEGRAFLTDRLLQAGQMLGDLWYSAWRQAPPDTFLLRELAKRKNGAAKANGATTE